jgi:hypothetical protein
MKLAKKRFDWDRGWRSQIDLEYGIDLTVTNDTDATIELVKSSCLLLSNSEFSIGGSSGSHYDEDIYVDPGEASEFQVITDNVFSSAINGDEDSVSAEISATFFSKVFVDLGEMAVPKNETSAALFENKVDVANSDFSIQGAVVHIEPSDDADRSLVASVGIKNSGIEMLQKVVARLTLFDRDGQQIEQGEVEEFVAPQRSLILSPSVYTKAGRLRGASVKLTTTFFKTVETCEITLKGPEKRK